MQDSGIGIDKENQKHIFSRFYRVDKARSRDQGGTGLGLSIVKWIAEAHQGHVEFESTPGQGSTFMLHVPVYREPVSPVGVAPRQPGPFPPRPAAPRAGMA